MTGVLVLCTSRIPLSYRRKAKTRLSAGLIFSKFEGLLIAAIAAQLCQA